MKTYSLEELKELAIPVFEANQVKSIVATTDGQFFLHENAADLHCKRAKVGKYKLTKPNAALVEDAVGELVENAEAIIDDLKAMSAENLARYQGCDYRERAFWISECTSEAEVNFYMQNEKTKTVLTAAENRIEELRNA